MLRNEMFQLGRKVDAMTGELRRLKEFNRHKLK
jgi:hypothetical protein